MKKIEELFETLNAIVLSLILGLILTCYLVSQQAHLVKWALAIVAPFFVFILIIFFLILKNNFKFWWENRRRKER